MKACSHCGETKPLEDFPKQKRGYLGRMAECKVCHRLRYQKMRAADPLMVRRWNLKKRFDLTPVEFDEMLAAQDGKCLGCGTTEAGGSGTFHIDHDHSTGEIRGLLCVVCNLRDVLAS